MKAIRSISLASPLPSSVFEIEKEPLQQRGSGEGRVEPANLQAPEEITGEPRDPATMTGRPMGWQEFAGKAEEPRRKGAVEKRDSGPIGFLGRRNSGERRIGFLRKRDSVERNIGFLGSKEKQKEPLEKRDSGERGMDSLAKFDSGGTPPVRRGSGERRRTPVRGTPVGRRGSGERRVEGLGRENSFEITRLFSRNSRNRHSDLIGDDLSRFSSANLGEVELSGTFSISPRNNSLEIDKIATEIRGYLGEKFPAPLAHVLGQVSFKQYMYLSPDGVDLATGLQNADLLKIFFSAVEDLTAEKSILSPVQCRRILEMGLRVIPHVSYLFENPEMKVKAERILLEGSEKAETPRFRELVLRAHEVINRVGKIGGFSEEIAEEELRQMSGSIQAVVQTPPISFKGLQLLLFWTQTDFSMNEDTFDLIAGIREWDTDENIYRFAIHRFMEMAQLDNRDPEVMVRLLYFIDYWHLVPANQGRDSLRNIAEWDQLAIHLSDPKQAKLRREIPEELIKDLLEPRKVPPEIHLPEVKGGNPLFRYDSKVVYQIWKEKWVVKWLQDSIVLYLLQSGQQGSVADLVSSKDKGDFISIRTKRSNQVTQLLAGQIRAAARRSIEEARQIIEILSCVQKELISVSAFEAEAAVYAVFRQPPIKRICRAFRDSKLFSTLFENPEIEALHGIKENGKKLRDLQDSRQKEGHGVVESSTLILWDLIQFRKNGADFTEKGVIDIDRLKMFGKIFHQFLTRREQALKFWASPEANLQPNPFFLMAFGAQTGEVGDEAVEDLYGLNMVQIRSCLGKNFPLVYILAEVSCNRYIHLSPDGMELAIGLQDKGLLKLFFSAVEKLTSERSPLSQVKRQRILEMGLRMIGQPHIRDLFSHPEMKSMICRILSVKLEKAQTPRFQQLVLRAQEAIEWGEGEEGSSEEIGEKGLQMMSDMRTPAVLLRDLQFLAFWIQADLLLNDDTLDLIAGLRKWDLDENIYRFAIQRFMEMSQSSHRDPEVMFRLLELICCWRLAPANRGTSPEKSIAEWEQLAPANRDAPSEKSIAEWEQLLHYLEDPQQEELKKEIPEDLFQAIVKLEATVPKIHLPEVERTYPSVDKASLAEVVPRVIHHEIWRGKGVVKQFGHSVVFFLLEARQFITVPDLFFSKGKVESVSLQIQRFNKVIQFLAGQILACKTSEEARGIVEVLCRVQDELMDLSAFEAAGAIYAALQQASIGRLRGAFQDIKPFTYLRESRSFTDLFDSPEMQAVFALEQNGKKLKELQDGGEEKGNGVFECFSLILWDLDHSGEWDGIREDDDGFIIDGVVSIDKLTRRGKLPNQFAARKQQALEFWTSSQKLQPHPFFLMAFEAQSGDINEAVQDEWAVRSKVIRQPGPGIKQCW